MKTPLLFLLCGGLGLFPLEAQDDSSGYVTAVAVCVGVRQTGKRHNSYFFTFRIRRVLDGRLRDEVDGALIVPSTSTPKIQEIHITLGHLLCMILETWMGADD